MASIPPSSPPPPSPRLLRFRLMSARTGSARTGSAEPPAADDSDSRANFNGSRFPDSTNIRQSGVGTPVEHGHDIVHRMTPVQNESPLHRAGLLQPKSYASSLSHMSAMRQMPVMPHSQDTIRDNTMQLSNMLFSPPPGAEPASLQARLTVPHYPKALGDIERPSSAPPTKTPAEFDQSVELSTTTTPFSPNNGGISAPRRHDTFISAFRPSGLSLLLAGGGQARPPQLDQPTEETTAEIGPSTMMPTLELPGHPPSITTPVAQQSGVIAGDSATPEYSHIARPTNNNFFTETAPLLGSSHPSYTPSPNATPRSAWDVGVLKNISYQIINTVRPENVKHVVTTAVMSLPAVLLGSLLNILDGVSYGMIIFPASGVFSDLGGMGVSLFFVTTVVSQLTYTLGGSGFAGANGSMMIEVVPFFHIMATSIANEIGEEHPREIVATTLVAFALSSVLTGISFLLLGVLRLGTLIGFFPRHILVGCIGGVGAFLIETGLTVSTRIDDDDFDWSLASLKIMFLEPHNVILWSIPLALAVLLRLITHKFHHQLIFPLYFLVMPMVFYIVVAAAQLNLGNLREQGWVFDMGNSGHESWTKFYSYIDPKVIRLGPLWSTLPTQLALLFFNVLHPPLNVPALSVSLNEDVDTNKELVAHGYSNLLAGIFVSVPNYLVYVNTLLFYRVGGRTRIAGFLLAIASIILLVIGTGPIAYIPVMVVGALIFVLGIDLVKEALWDTRHRVSRMEYVTIASIMVCMTAWDFVTGVLFGIIVSCLFFVIQNSQRRSIRAFHTGETCMSTVRRPSSQRAYIREVSRQTTILRLQGFLFFGTISRVEETIRNLVEGPSWHRNPIRFLVLDLTHVAGVDMSSAEALVRVQRLLASKRVVLVFCGFSAESSVGKSLQSVDVLGAEGVELFSAFNDAMEWTENAYLRAWFKSQKVEAVPVVLPGRQDSEIAFYQSIASSPRQSHLRDAGNRTIANEIVSSEPNADDAAEPFNTLVKAFASYGEFKRDTFQPLISLLERVSVPEGLVLWRQGDDSDGLYIIQSGVLRASYVFADYTPRTEESMVPGTLAGELSALSGMPRNSTVVVERQGVLWKLRIENLRRLEVENPRLARTFIQLVLKAAKIDYDILLSALATRQ